MTILLILVSLFFLSILITAFITNILYWYEATNCPCPATQTPRPGLWVCLKMYLRTFGGYCVAMCIRPIASCTFTRKKPGEGRDATHPPLMLVHGLYHNSSAWIFHRPRLEKAGYTTTMFKYGSFRALDTVMEQFEQHIRQIEGVYPNRKPVLIGHSLGGVLIRAWLLNPDNHKRIAGVITLGTPHGGSRLAMLGFGAMVKHITPQADLIKALKNAERIDALPCVSLLSSTDEMVLPSENLLPPNEWQARLIHNVNHYGLLTNSMIGQAILRELNEMETRNG